MGAQPDKKTVIKDLIELGTVSYTHLLRFLLPAKTDGASTRPPDKPFEPFRYIRTQKNRRYGQHRKSRRKI